MSTNVYLSVIVTALVVMALFQLTRAAIGGSSLSTRALFTPDIDNKAVEIVQFELEE